MFCKNCGNQVHDQAVVCPNCGTQVREIQTKSQNSGGNENVVGLIGFILSFFIPIAGLICSIIGYKKARDEGAKYKSLSLAGIIICSVIIGMYVLILIFYFIIIFSAIFSSTVYALIV